MIDLTQVLTFSEAAEKWGFSNGNTLRKAVERKKFQPHEIRKSGDIWLTTYEAMLRVFGQPRTSCGSIAINDIAHIVSNRLYNQEKQDYKYKQLMNKIHMAIQQEKTITIIQDKDHPNTILSVIKTTEDLDTFLNLLERYLSTFTD